MSYLTAWVSGSVIVSAHQQITRDWWDHSRQSFELFVSAVTLREAAAGDPVAALERLEALAGLPELDVTIEAELLAQELLDRLGLAARAAIDALYISVATVHGMDYLLTWNCAHIANATLRSRIEAACCSRGFEPPIICTREELLEESQNA